MLEFLKKKQASNRNLLFATPDTYGLQAAFDPLMPAAVPFTLVIAPSGDVVYQELGSLDILKLRRAILANVPDDGAHPGVQAYWAATSARRVSALGYEPRRAKPRGVSDAAASPKGVARGAYAAWGWGPTRTN